MGFKMSVPKDYSEGGGGGWISSRGIWEMKLDAIEFQNGNPAGAKWMRCVFSGTDGKISEMITLEDGEPQRTSANGKDMTWKWFRIVGALDQPAKEFWELEPEDRESASNQVEWTFTMLFDAIGTSVWVYTDLSEYKGKVQCKISGMSSPRREQTTPVFGASGDQSIREPRKGKQDSKPNGGKYYDNKTVW